jgi:hypothetical protein
VTALLGNGTVQLLETSDIGPVIVVEATAIVPPN